jgi:hypothetical protein
MVIRLPLDRHLARTTTPIDFRGSERDRHHFSRWETCPAVDPIAYLEARRSCRSDDTTWARPYLEWAERGAMIGPRCHGDDPLTRHPHPPAGLSGPPWMADACRALAELADEVNAPALGTHNP